MPTLIPPKAFPFFHLETLFSCSTNSTVTISNVLSLLPPPTLSLQLSTTTFLMIHLAEAAFLTNKELEKLKALESFVYLQELECGSLWVRVMRADEMDLTVGLLALSFAESVFMSLGCEALLRFLVKQYLIKRRAVVPHAVTLVGFYREKVGQRGEELAGAVEVCLDKRGANASPPTPTPPKNSPCISNMTVTKQLRRRGIGWHLLRARR